MTILTGDVVINKNLHKDNPSKTGIVVATGLVNAVYCPKAKKIVMYTDTEMNGKLLEVVGHINLERAMEEAIKEGI